MEAKILQILEKHKVHPFWIEFFDGQHMIQPVVLSRLHTLVPRMEEIIKSGIFDYASFTSYYKGDLGTFQVPLGEIVVFEQISEEVQALRAKTEPLLEVSKTGHKLFDLMADFLGGKQKFYPKVIKEISLLLFLSGGPSTYNLLVDLLPLPSLPTIRRELGIIKPVTEGELRIKELKEFLVKNNLPLDVYLSEDATRCISQVEYDSRQDKFVGFVLGVDENGMPKVDSYKNIRPDVLRTSLMNDPKSNYLYTMVAQPLKRGAPSFCLFVFGTNNCFNADVVHKRFEFIVKSLAEVGIGVVGWSSDGDIRLLNTMKLVCGLKCNNDQSSIPEMIRNFYFSNMNVSTSPIQDIKHLITKLRNGLLSNPLSIGNHLISIAFLQNLVNLRPKGEHELSQTDIDANDRMNVDSAIRLFQPNVVSLLEMYYPQETKGLVLFLILMRNTYDAFSPHEEFNNRFIKIWFNIFVLRAWRHLSKKNNNMKTCVTSNVYSCMELNGHMLINVYRKLRDSGKLSLFIPELFSSQPCESFFRCARSLTSTQSTVINFTTKQFLDKIKRIDTIISLSTEYKNAKDLPLFEVPYVTDDSLYHLIVVAKSQADAKLSELGIELQDEFSRIALEPEKRKCKKEEDDSDMEMECDVEEDSLENDDVLIEDASGYLEEARQAATNNQYFTLRHSSGEEFSIRKGYMCKMFQTKDNVSTDRLHRFRCTPSTSSQTTTTTTTTLSVDEWVLFNNVHYVCHILYFKNLNKKTKKETSNKSQSIQITPENQSKVGAMCTFFKVNLTESNLLQLKLTNAQSFVIPLSDFKLKLSKPFTGDNETLFYEDIMEIETIHSHLNEYNIN